MNIGEIPFRIQSWKSNRPPSNHQSTSTHLTQARMHLPQEELPILPAGQVRQGQWPRMNYSAEYVSSPLNPDPLVRHRVPKFDDRYHDPQELRKIFSEEILQHDPWQKLHIQAVIINPKSRCNFYYSRMPMFLVI